jgi:hypothetical protein
MCCKLVIAKSLRIGGYGCPYVQRVGCVRGMSTRRVELRWNGVRSGRQEIFEEEQT